MAIMMIIVNVPTMCNQINNMQIYKVKKDINKIPSSK